jgi:GTPase
MNASAKKCAFVALIGIPNAGKSTLMNQLLGTKISIVTPKVQTTRSRLVGIGMFDETQIVFSDTPGIFNPQKKLHQAMVGAAWREAENADISMYIVDAKRGITKDDEAILERVKHLKKVTLLINKVDKVNKLDLLTLTKTLTEKCDFDRVFMISALEGEGLDEVISYLQTEAPKGPWHYPDDQLMDISDRLFSAEITREKLFLELRKELPYSLSVETEDWEKFADGSIKISQAITVETKSQKMIVIGNKGQMIKKIGIASRLELEKIYEGRIHLALFVKVRKNWQDDPDYYHMMGLDYPK